MKTESVKVLGSRGFTFELKPGASGIFYTRYQDGDRGGSPATFLPWCYTATLIKSHFADTAGANKRIVRAVLVLWDSNKTTELDLLEQRINAEVERLERTWNRVADRLMELGRREELARCKERGAV